MTGSKTGIIAAEAMRAAERFDDARRGDAFWFTLFSSDRTPTHGMSTGLMVIPPHGGRLGAHRHQQAEVYFVQSGSGVLTVEGVESALTAGAAAFIPGDAEHGLRNDGAEALRIFYVFPTDSFAEIVYRFEPDRVP